MDPKRLREETRAEHEAAEALMPVMTAGLTRAGYAEVLVALQPIVESWEAWAETFAPREVQGLLEGRGRRDLLRADLRAMGVAQPATEQPRVDWGQVLGFSGSEGEGFAAAFLGGLYVMEGSTLGGRFVARHVEAVLGLRRGEGNAYFEGYGDATGAMWREVTACLSEVPEALAPVVVEAARRTFRAFGDALRGGLAASQTGQG